MSLCHTEVWGGDQRHGERGKFKCLKREGRGKDISFLGKDMFTLKIPELSAVAFEDLAASGGVIIAKMGKKPEMEDLKRQHVETQYSCLVVNDNYGKEMKGTRSTARL